MKKLIIKSGSMERLSSLMKQLGEEAVTILTHEHWAEAITAEQPNAKVVTYNFKESFNKAGITTLLQVEELADDFDEVIILTSNISGKGHENVIEAVSSIGKQIKLFNINGKLMDIDSEKGKPLYLVALSATLIFVVISGIWLSICCLLTLPFREKQG